MNHSELKLILGAVKNERRGGAPNELWVEQSRDILMMQVRNTMDTKVQPTTSERVQHLLSIFFPSEQLALVARGFGAFMLVVGTLFGGGLVSAQAFRDAAPGQTMYSMKLAVESAQMLLAPNEDYRGRLHAEFADRRADELAGLAEGAVVNERHVIAALGSFRKEIDALRTGLESMRVTNPTGVVEMAKLLERKTAVYQDVLRKSAGVLPVALRSSINDVQVKLDAVTLAAMSVIVEKHLAGDVGAPKAVVDIKFEDNIKQAEAKLGTVGEGRATEAKAAIAAAKDLVRQENYQAALTKMVEVADLIKAEEAIAPAATAETTADKNIDAQDPSVPVDAVPTETAGSGSR